MIYQGNDSRAEVVFVAVIAQCAQRTQQDADTGARKQ